MEELVETPMGRRPELRFRFIQENAEFAAEELDIWGAFFPAKRGETINRRADGGKAC